MDKIPLSKMAPEALAQYNREHEEMIDRKATVAAYQRRLALQRSDQSISRGTLPTISHKRLSRRPVGD